MAKIFSIRDLKAEAFNVSFEALNSSIAMRDVQTALAQRDSPMARYPEDFDLFLVGHRNIDTGVVTGEPAPVHVCAIADLVEKEQSVADT